MMPAACGLSPVSADSVSRPKTKSHGSGLKTFLGKCRLGDKGDKSGQLTKYFTCLTGSLTYPEVTLDNS